MLAYVGPQLCNSCNISRKREFHGARYKIPFTRELPKFEVCVLVSDFVDDDDNDEKRLVSRFERLLLLLRVVKQILSKSEFNRFLLRVGLTDFTLRMYLSTGAALALNGLKNNLKTNWPMYVWPFMRCGSS